MDTRERVVEVSSSIGSQPAMYLPENTFPSRFLSGSTLISTAPCILLSLCGNLWIGLSPVGSNLTLPELSCTSRPTSTQSKKFGLRSISWILSVIWATGNLVPSLRMMASCKVMGSSAFVRVICMGSGFSYLAMYLSQHI